MDTKILEPTEENIKIAGKIAADGGLVAFPTETVYGLGADALNADAVKAVYAAKGRPSDNPMIVHIAENDDIKNLTPEVTEVMRKLMDAFWPGPLTMVVPKMDIIPDTTTGGLDTAGIRMPSEKIARNFIRAAGCPIAAPSANLSGKPSPTTAQHVIDDMDGRIDAILKGPDCQVGIESTVLDVTGDVPMILRPGIITADEITAVTGIETQIDPAVLRKSKTDERFVPKAPGMKYRHYAPEAEMHIVSGETEAVRKKIEELKKQAEAEGKTVEVILFGEEEFKEAAHELFGRLREADKSNVDLILAGALNDSNGVGFAVMNRMLKSAGYSIIYV